MVATWTTEARAMGNGSDIQNGDVLVNWQVTAVVIVVFLGGFSLYLGASPGVAVFLGVYAVVIWLSWELYVWEPGASVDEVGSSDEDDDWNHD